MATDDSAQDAPGRDPEALTQITHSILPFAARTGIRIDRADRGSVQLTMPLQPNVNHVGTMYAGALFTLAEIPGGTLSATTFDVEKYYPIVKDLQITFLKPATTDISVEVTMSDDEIDRLLTTANEVGKVDYSWDSELVDAGGVVVAKSKNLYQLRSRDMPLRKPE